MPFAQYSKKNVTKLDDPYGTAALDRQIANADTRIQDAGYSPQKADRRNWLEKATNMNHQNWLFDALELLGRPANAIKNVIDKTVVDKTQSAGQSILKGLSGQQKVSGTDLVKKTDVNNGFAKFILGTGLDIALDPVTYIPGGVIAKGAKAASKVVTVPAKVGYNALESASPALKTFRETRLAPAAESIKDGFGYAFKPGYKDTETLTGGQSNFLSDLKLDTENKRRFMQEESLGNIVKTAKETGVGAGTEVGRIMEAPLKQFDEAGNAIPRQMSELSTDPKIQAAAANLTKSDQLIRQLAVDNGIDIKDMEGYMTHVLSQAERDFRKTRKITAVDRGRFGTGNPNKKILNERKLMGSAEEVNQKLAQEGYRAEGHNFFEPNAYFASAIGQKRLIDYTQAVQFRRKVLSNTDFAHKYEKGMVIPHNAEVIDTNKYKFLKESGDILDGVDLADEIGGQYVVTKAVKQALDQFQHVNTDEGTKAFLKAIGGASSLWKKLALFSPGYHVRNFIGNMWNSYAIGMNPYQITKYTGEAVGEISRALKGNESALFNEFRQQGLLFSGFTKVEMRSGMDMEKSIEKAVKQMSKRGTAKVADKVIHPFQSSRDLGESADMVNRYAMYKWARDKGMDAKEAAQKVREALFDYMDLTPFEQNTMRNLFPFYTWTRKNMPYQIQRFIQHPEKFQKLNYLRQNALQNVDLDQENIPDYMKENFYFPVFGKEGKGKMLAANLPVGDLTKLADPLKLGADLFTPLIKTPLELASNYNMFKRKPIKKFEGQTKQLQIPGTDRTIDIPIDLAYALEQATGQVGRGVTNFLQKPENVDQANKFASPTLGISSFLKDFDSEKYAYYEKLDQLRKLQDLILYIQQQEGAKPRTVAEIKRGR